MTRTHETGSATGRYSKDGRGEAPAARRNPAETALAVAVIASGLTMGVLTMH